MKKQLFFIFLFIWQVSNPLFAQNDLNADDTSGIDLSDLIKKTDELKTSDSNQFKKNLEKLKNRLNAASSYQLDFINYLLAYEYILDGNLGEAQLKLKNIIQSTSYSEVKIRTTATLANIQAIVMDYDEALSNIDYVLENVNSLNDNSLIDRINLIASIVYYQLEIFEMSLKYASILKASDSGAMMKCKASVYVIRSKMALKISQVVKKVNEVINYCKEQNEIIYASLLELDWIHVSLDEAVMNQNESSIFNQLEKVKLLESSIDAFGYNNLIGLKDMLMAKAFYFNGQYDIAMDKANQAIEGSSQSGFTAQVLEAMKVLQSVALKKDDYKQAFEWGQKISDAERELSTQAKLKQMAYMAVKHDNLTKQIEIQQLKQNNQVLSLENKLSEEKASKQQLFILLVIVSLFLLGVWTYRIKKKHDYFKGVADIDHLTKVFTRKAFEEKVNVMLDECQAENIPLNLAIMDLDHFKTVNDRFGHLVGDWVLREVVLTCENVTDEDILIARLGGEEFCIVSPSITQAAMMRLMERLRTAIEQLDSSDSGAEFRITASFGVSSTRLSGYLLPTLLSHADLALFEAKNGGRNKVVAYENKTTAAYV